jgi:glycosyltransferase 2 family protein
VLGGLAAWGLARLIASAGGVGAVAAATGRIDAAHWVVLVPATLLFYSLDWLRYGALLSLLGHRLPYRLGLELSAVAYFATCLTPTAELSVPAMVWWLVRAGVPVGTATAATLTKSLYVLGWVCVTGLVGLAWHTGPVLPPGLGGSLAVALVVPIALVLGLIAAMLWPTPIRAACARRLRPATVGWRRALWAGLDDTVAAIAVIGRSRSRAHLLSHAACLAFIACYVAIGWWIADGVGLALDLRRATTSFTGSLLVSYIAPTPGGAGATEGATAYLLDPSLPVEATAAALVLRILTMYAIAPIGLVLMVRAARRLGGRALLRELRTPSRTSDELAR